MLSKGEELLNTVHSKDSIYHGGWLSKLPMVKDNHRRVMKFSKGQLRERWFVLDGKRDVLEYYKIKKERHDAETLFKLKTQGAQKTIHITAETVVRIYDSNFGPPQGFEKRPGFEIMSRNGSLPIFSRQPAEAMTWVNKIKQLQIFRMSLRAKFRYIPREYVSTELADVKLAIKQKHWSALRLKGKSGEWVPLRVAQILDLQSRKHSLFRRIKVHHRDSHGRIQTYARWQCRTEDPEVFQSVAVVKAGARGRAKSDPIKAEVKQPVPKQRFKSAVRASSPKAKENPEPLQLKAKVKAKAKLKAKNKVKVYSLDDFEFPEAFRRRGRLRPCLLCGQTIQHYEPIGGYCLPPRPRKKVMAPKCNSFTEAQKKEMEWEALLGDVEKTAERVKTPSPHTPMSPNSPLRRSRLKRPVNLTLFKISMPLICCEACFRFHMSGQDAVISYGRPVLSVQVLPRARFYHPPIAPDTPVPATPRFSAYANMFSEMEAEEEEANAMTQAGKEMIARTPVPYAETPRDSTSNGCPPTPMSPNGFEAMFTEMEAERERGGTEEELVPLFATLNSQSDEKEQNGLQPSRSWVRQTDYSR